MNQGSVTASQDGQERDVKKVHLEAKHLYSLADSVIIICCNYYKAECNPPCENGGECFIPGHCACPTNWDGPRCEEGIYTLVLLPLSAMKVILISLNSCLQSALC